MMKYCAVRPVIVPPTPEKKTLPFAVVDMRVFDCDPVSRVVFGNTLLVDRALQHAPEVLAELGGADLVEGRHDHARPRVDAHQECRPESRQMDGLAVLRRDRHGGAHQLALPEPLEDGPEQFPWRVSLYSVLSASSGSSGSGIMILRKSCRFSPRPPDRDGAAQRQAKALAIVPVVVGVLAHAAILDGTRTRGGATTRGASSWIGARSRCSHHFE